MRMPPDVNGHGGSQRAWHLLNALLPHGDVHFVLLYRELDGDCMYTSLAPLEPLAASVTRINIAEWQPRMTKIAGFIPGGVQNFLKMRSAEAPRFSARQIDRIAEQLPVSNPDIIFAGRLCVAFILQSLIDRKLLSARQRVVDFDDIMSKFAARQMRGGDVPLRKRVRLFFDSIVVARAENRIANGWHGVSVCTDEDVADLRNGHPSRAIVKVPNVVARPRLPARAPDGTFKILFAGNLSFAPNVDGLRLFIEKAWSKVKAAVPGAELTVVGMGPSAAVRELTDRFNVPLHANVPSLRPFYEDCDVVIAPILFGSGTRIKILEAMAYGRSVVSTTVGAEGMGLQHGKHLLISDTMDDFARSLSVLAGDPEGNRAMADRAHAFQQENYTPMALSGAVSRLLAQFRAREST